jgi:hypothetical protein
MKYLYSLGLRFILKFCKVWGGNVCPLGGILMLEYVMFALLLHNGCSLQKNIMLDYKLKAQVSLTS